MSQSIHTFVLDEAGLARLAALVALEMRAGDLVTLTGELGAGKTTFARAAIRAQLDDAEAEVPSPTFSLVQVYETPRGNITHCDLYRIDDAGAVAELGIEEALARGTLVVEWPERAAALLAQERLDVALAEVDGGVRRRVSLTGSGGWARRLDRLMAIRGFIASGGWGDADIGPIPGDASARRYLRLRRGGRGVLVMDAPRMPDGPPIRDGKPYSRIAHLAEDVRPFVAVARHLSALGLSAPQIITGDLAAGLLLTEDLGDRVFGAELASGADQRTLWRAAVDALLVLHRAPLPQGGRLPVGDGTFHDVPQLEAATLQIEVELLADWYVPALASAPLAAQARGAFLAAWQPVMERLARLPTGLMLRDFHSPNLLWLPDRQGSQRVGVIDFQDALIGPLAYDLVSLLQDARLDVAGDIEAELLAHYCVEAAGTSAFDAAGFRWAYAALGAQRNTKILGIFARLARRDGKPSYLAHIPRIWRYLERDLAHPELAELRAWYDQHLPPDLRVRPIAP